MEEFQRTALLLGKAAAERLNRARVAIFGVGGVGSYAAEGLARSGIGGFTLVDHDVVTVSNINRQIIALHSTLGRYKAQVMKERILDINPQAEVEVRTEFYLPDMPFRFEAFSYVIDAVDTVTAKLAIIMGAKAAGTPVISCMGAGNKLDPSQLRIADISKTSVCPLARVMRHELSKRRIQGVKVLFSAETPISPAPHDPDTRRQTPGSVAYVPSVAGLMIAGEVVKDLIAE